MFYVSIVGLTFFRFLDLILCVKPFLSIQKDSSLVLLIGNKSQWFTAKSRMIRVPNSVIWYLPDLPSSSLPSFCQRMVGGGIPMAAHSSCSVSPIVKVNSRLASAICGGTKQNKLKIYRCTDLYTIYLYTDQINHTDHKWLSGYWVNVLHFSLSKKC